MMSSLSFMRPCQAVLFVAIIFHQLIVTVFCKVPSVLNPPSHVLDPTNPFLENFEKNTTWNDPVLREYFYGRNRQATVSKKKGPTVLEYKLNNPKNKTLAARANFGPAPYGPLIDFPSCLSCQGKSKRDATLSVAKNFMADQMIAKMNLFATIGDCIFYGQRPPGLTNPRSLSVPASDYACSRGGFAARTIWHLWPNEGCEADQNYYCLNPREPNCCWLNPLMPGQTQNERIPQSMVYFQQMSRAMALTCTGEVFILIDNPDDVLVQQPDPWPSIWLSHELPALRGLYEKGVVTKLTAVRYSDKAKVDKTSAIAIRNNPRDVDPEQEEWDHAITRAIAKKRAELLKSGIFGNMTLEEAKLQRREGPCGSAADQEAPGLDYFG